MSSFGPRRRARIIGQDTVEDGSDDIGPSIKCSSRPKQRSSRISFGPDASSTSMVDEEANEGLAKGAVITPRRILGRSAPGKATARKSSPAASVLADTLPVRRHYEQDKEWPSYSKDSLAKLRNAQQSQPPLQPNDDRAPSEGDPFARELNVAAKFGTNLARYERQEGNLLIPTDAEIQEKKARRARLAKMAKQNIEDGSDEYDDQDRYDRLGSDEDEFLTHRDKISLRDETAISKRDEDTRLTRDDEDFMEGLGDFTGEDSRILLGRHAEEDARAQKRLEMQEMIEAAQECGEGDEDDSDRELKEEYEALQTQKGIESLRANGYDGRHEVEDGARTPPRITPIPSLSSCVDRLRARLLNMEADRAAKLGRLEELEEERRDIAQREVQIQTLLRDTAERYEKLTAEAGLTAPTVTHLLPESYGLSNLDPLQANGTI